MSVLGVKRHWSVSSRWLGTAVVVEEARHQNVREKVLFLRRATFLVICCCCCALLIRTKKFMDLSARLLLLVVAVTTITTCAAQEGRDDKVFANYDALKRNGQAFLLSSQKSLYEEPEKKAIPVYILDWFSGFSFDLPADDTNSSDEFEFEGYVGRGVNYFLGNSLRGIQSSGADIPKINLDVEKPGLVLEISSSYVPALGAFEGRWLAVTDAWRCTFWDDGSNRSGFCQGRRPRWQPPHERLRGSGGYGVDLGRPCGGITQRHNRPIDAGGARQDL